MEVKPSAWTTLSSSDPRSISFHKWPQDSNSSSSLNTKPVTYDTSNAESFIFLFDENVPQTREKAKYHSIIYSKFRIKERRSQIFCSCCRIHMKVQQSVVSDGWIRSTLPTCRQFTNCSASLDLDLPGRVQLRTDLFCHQGGRAITFVNEVHTELQMQITGPNLCGPAFKLVLAASIAFLRELYQRECSVSIQLGQRSFVELNKIKGANIWCQHII